MWNAVPLVALLLAPAPMTQGHECKNCQDIAEGYTPGEFFLFLTAQTKKNNAKTFFHFFSAVFDFDQNLSFENCGQWKERNSARAPWRIAVGRTDGATCFGILLSDFNFITCELQK